MLNVVTPEEVYDLIQSRFLPLCKTEMVSLGEACGRVLAEDIAAKEFVPDFDRSTVDGYALKASDTFGCSDAIPAILSLRGQVLMGQSAEFFLKEGECCYVPTGGALPDNADCVVMIEYSEDFRDGTIGISKAGAPGMNVIYRGDDVYPGKTILSAGRILNACDIGSLAAIGCTQVPVRKRVKVGIISTGDELVPPDTVPGPGQVRDVNSPMLTALLQSYGAESVSYGIVVDDEELLRQTVIRALTESDILLISGGSSVGVKDAACRIIESQGELLFHGIAIKPGKPTILGKSGNRPVFGLPGHPVAAFTVAKLFVTAALDCLSGTVRPDYPVTARISESIGANHGRAQYGSVRLTGAPEALTAEPVRTKSGLITNLAGTDGFYCIERNREGLEKDAEVKINVF